MPGKMSKPEGGIFRGPIEIAPELRATNSMRPARRRKPKRVGQVLTTVPTRQGAARTGPSAAPAPSARKHKKKGKGAASVVARMLNSGAGGLANYLLPGSGTLVSKLGSSILDSFGLAEKTRLPADFGASEGGSVIQTASAPVAFARGEQTMTSIEHLGTSGGDAIYRIRDYIGEIGAPATVGGRNVYIGINKPSVSYPLFDRVAGIYELYKLLGAKLHYVHYAPTSVQSRVILAAANIQFDYIAADAQDFVTLENSTVGSCYEDFAMEWIPADVLNWYSVYAPYEALNVSSYQGTWYTYVDQTSAADVNRPLGSLYIEYYVAFRNQRSPDLPLNLLARAIAHEPAARQRQALTFALERIDGLTTHDVRSYLVELEKLPPEQFYNVRRKSRSPDQRTGFSLPSATLTRM